jgi:hypothetical protein
MKVSNEAREKQHTDLNLLILMGGNALLSQIAAGYIAEATPSEIALKSFRKLALRSSVSAPTPRNRTIRNYSVLLPLQIKYEG